MFAHIICIGLQTDMPLLDVIILILKLLEKKIVEDLK